MVDDHLRYSPPAAYPCAGQFSSFSPGAPPPRSNSPASNPWARSGTFLLSGSTAPPIVNTRRPPPLRGHSVSSSSVSTQLSQGQSSRQGSPVLMTEAACCCCATRVRFPRDSPCYRCTVCEVTNDLPPKQKRRRLSSDRPSEAITGARVAELQRVFGSPSPASIETDEEMAIRLHRIELGDSPAPERASGALGEQDRILSAELMANFTSLAAVDGSFLPEIGAPDPDNSRRRTLGSFYDLVQSGPEALELLISSIEALLARPGEGFSELSGHWIVVLLESPVFTSTLNPDSLRRREMFSKFIGLVANAPSQQQHSLVRYLSNASHPLERLRSHIQLLIPHLSHVILSSISTTPPSESWRVRTCAKVASLFLAARDRIEARPGRSSIRLSEFYVTAIDALGEEEWIEDFLRWESSSENDLEQENRSEFRFCQYPFLLSLGIKQRLLDFENQRQIMDEAEAAMRSNLSSFHRGVVGEFPTEAREMPILSLNIRRTRLVQDSLQQISNNRTNLRKSLRIKFEGEEGIDAGGLRKEWFLLLCRSLFSPSYGMFVTLDGDQGSNLCWFNPGSVGLVDEEDFWLLGAAVGMGCYHADTLDIPLPTATFKKLRGEPCSSLADLAQFQPALARGLQQLLDHDGDDVEEVFCRQFVGTYEAFGDLVEVELQEGGKTRPVTNANREEFVDLLVDFILNKSIAHQFEAFSAGFNEVCSGNTLSLLRGEELELTVRGSEEPLDVETLRSVTTLHGFYDDDQVILDFWTVLKGFSPQRQKQFLAFVTATDRIPSTGITALHLKITCIGRVDSERLPTSHSCFNELCLWSYDGGCERLERLLITAMEESEGFGLR